MWFPKGRRPDSGTYSRSRLPDSGLQVFFRHLMYRENKNPFQEKRRLRFGVMGLVSRGVSSSGAATQ